MTCKLLREAQHFQFHAMVFVDFVRGLIRVRILFFPETAVKNYANKKKGPTWLFRLYGGGVILQFVSYRVMLYPILGIPPKKSASISWNVICLLFFLGSF